MFLKILKQAQHTQNMLRQDFNNRVDSMYTNYIKSKYIEVTPLTPIQQMERVLDPNVIFVGSIWVYPGEWKYPDNSEDITFFIWNGEEFEELKEVPKCYQNREICYEQ